MIEAIEHDEDARVLTAIRITDTRGSTSVLRAELILSFTATSRSRAPEPARVEVIFHTTGGRSFTGAADLMEWEPVEMALLNVWDRLAARPLV